MALMLKQVYWIVCTGGASHHRTDHFRQTFAGTAEFQSAAPYKPCSNMQVTDNPNMQHQHSFTATHPTATLQH